MSNWLAYSPTSGVGNGTITLTAETLSELEDRVATLVAKSQTPSDLSATTVVTQKGISPTSITFYNLTWVTDISYIGGTASSANCSYAIYANYADGRSADVTANATVIGSVSAPFSLNIERHSVGNLILTASYENITTTSSVTAYQEASPLAEYLTFNIISGGTLYWSKDGYGDAKTISYSKDNGATWNSITSTLSGTSINVSDGDVVYFKGDNQAYSDWNYYYENGTTNKFTASDGLELSIRGNIMSLIDSDGFTTAYTLTSGRTFYFLFGGLDGLITAENLILPATSLAEDCYMSMFNSCSNLEKPPVLLATTLATRCYNGMFQSCTGLTTPPELPATTLADSCYMGMFSGCTSLTTAPELPATTLADSCYRSMFSYCKRLTIAPELPATTLADYCYAWMFDECSWLTTAPSELPATTLADYCYYEMFYYCTNLTTVPSRLPATTPAQYCYYGMFRDCSSLTTAPEIPNIYANMSYMFNGCTSLNYIKCLVDDVAYIGRQYWVRGVSRTGTFVKSTNATWTTGDSGIPNGWTVINA